MSEGTEPVLVDNGLGGEGGVVELDGVGGGARGGGEGLDQGEGLKRVPGFGVGMGVACEVFDIDSVDYGFEEEKIVTFINVNLCIIQLSHKGHLLGPALYHIHL